MLAFEEQHQDADYHSCCPQGAKPLEPQEKKSEGSEDQSILDWLPTGGRKRAQLMNQVLSSQHLRVNLPLPVDVLLVICS